MTSMQFLKWLYPGMRVKRWLFTAVTGVLLFGIGSGLLPVEGGNPLWAARPVFPVTGVCLLVMGGGLIVRSLLEVVSPGHLQDLVDQVFQQRYLEKGPKIVVIGGGTGRSTPLHGL